MWRWRRHAATLHPSDATGLHPRYTALTFTTVELARRAADGPHTDDRLFISRTIDVVAAILDAPLSPETERLNTERQRRLSAKKKGRNS
jgi:hypothetical protein